MLSLGLPLTAIPIPLMCERFHKRTFLPLHELTHANRLCLPMQRQIVSISDYARGSFRPTGENDATGELRTAVRYNLALRAVFRWKDGGLIRQAEGTTRDVSTRSAYVVAEVCPPRGAKIEIKIGLLEGCRGRPASWLDAEGAVSRVEPARPGHQGGFVVESVGARSFTR